MTDETSSANTRDPAQPRLSVVPATLSPRPMSLTLLGALAVLALVIGAVSTISSATSTGGESLPGLVFGIVVLSFGGVALVGTLVASAVHAMLEAHLRKTLTASAAPPSS